MRFLFVNLGHAYAHFFLLVYPAVVVVLQSRDGGDYGDLLLPSTVGFVCFAAGALPAGWLGDRWSRPAMLALQFLLLGAGALLAAARADAGLLLPGLALVGLGASIYHPVGLPLAAETGAAGGRGVGRALGVNGVWGNLGVAAAPLVSTWLAARWGWQSAFLVPGALSLATGLAFLPLCRRWSREPHPGQTPQHGAAGAVDGAAERRRIMLFLLASSLIGGLVFASVTVALPAMLAEVAAQGMAAGSTLGAAGLASLIFALAAFAQLPAGRAVDRLGPRRLVVLLALPQVALLVLLGLVGGPGGGWLAVAGLALVVPLIFGEIPVYDSLAVRAAAARWRARFFAAVYLVSLGVSAAAVPVVAWLHDAASGFRPLFLLLAATVCGVVLLALALLPGGRPQPGPAAAPAMAQTNRRRSI